MLKDPTEYAAQLMGCYLKPNVVRIVVDLARYTPALPLEYIEAVADELRKLGAK